MNEHLQDVMIRNQIFIQGRSEDEVETLFLILVSMTAGVSKVLSTSLSRSGVSAGTLREVDTLIDYALGDIEAQLDTSARGLAEYQAAFLALAVGAMTTRRVVTPVDIAMRAISAPMLLDRSYGTVDTLYRQFTSTMRQQVQTAIRQGVLRGESLQKIVREITRTVEKRGRQQLSATVTTVFNHVTDAAQQVFVEENPSFFGEEEWVAILDGRTSAICRARDGMRWPYNEGPRPPAHFNCRSRRIPIIDERKIKPEYRGKAPKRMTYNDWLQRQPNKVQDQILGIKKAELYRKGGITLDKFVSPRGKTYTLADLKRLEPLAFERSGV